jgi:hypothetical protein
MKRKKLEIKKENSQKENSNNISLSFFSNNIRENTMNIEISKSYKIGDRTFSSLEEANEHLIEEMISRGSKWVIENKAQVIAALQQFGKPDTSTSTNRTYSNTGKGNLEMIKERLKGRYHVRRDEDTWPVYHFHNDTEYHVIRYTGKVWQLYDLVILHESDLSPIFKQYGM